MSRVLAFMHMGAIAVWAWSSGHVAHDGPWWLHLLYAGCVVSHMASAYRSAMRVATENR